MPNAFLVRCFDLPPALAISKRPRLITGVDFRAFFPASFSSASPSNVTCFWNAIIIRLIYLILFWLKQIQNDILEFLPFILFPSQYHFVLFCLLHIYSRFSCNVCLFDTPMTTQRAIICACISMQLAQSVSFTAQCAFGSTMCIYLHRDSRALQNRFLSKYISLRPHSLAI